MDEPAQVLFPEAGKAAARMKLVKPSEVKVAQLVDAMRRFEEFRADRNLHPDESPNASHTEYDKWVRQQNERGISSGAQAMAFGSWNKARQAAEQELNRQFEIRQPGSKWSGSSSVDRSADASSSSPRSAKTVDLHNRFIAMKPPGRK